MSDDSEPTEELLTKNAAIYSNWRRKLSVSILRDIDGISDVKSDAGFLRRPTFLEFSIDGISVRLNTMFDQQRISEQQSGMHDWVDRIHSITPLMNMDVLHGYIDEINQVYGVQVDSAFALKSPVFRALLRIAQPIEGVILIHDSWIDCEGNLMFGLLEHVVDHPPDGD